MAYERNHNYLIDMIDLAGFFPILSLVAEGASNFVFTEIQGFKWRAERSFCFRSCSLSLLYACFWAAYHGEIQVIILQQLVHAGREIT